MIFSSTAAASRLDQGGNCEMIWNNLFLTGKKIIKKYQFLFNFYYTFCLLCDHNQIHQDEHCHKYLHLQSCSCRCLGHQHAALPERQIPHENLAIWGCPLQAHYCHRLLQHVHKYLHPHNDECRSLHRRVPPSQGAGVSDACQGQVDQHTHLGPVLGNWCACHDHGCDQSGRQW